MNDDIAKVLRTASTNKLKCVPSSTTFGFSGANITLFQTIRNLGVIIDSLTHLLSLTSLQSVNQSGLALQDQLPQTLPVGFYH